jgi:hypothetical protein
MNGGRESTRQRSADERVLRIYVAEHCGTCRESRRLAKVLAGRMPGSAVDVVDIDHREPVDEIFAVPTFCYSGKILSLGNPREDELVARVLSMEQGAERAAMAGTGHAGTIALASAAVAAPRGRTSAGGTGWLTACCGAVGIGGSILCSLTMVAPALGLIAMQTARPSMAGMSGPASAGDAQLPAWWETIVRLGPEILVVSVLLVAITAALGRRLAALPATAGGVILYLGMYAQPNVVLMEAATAPGLALLVLAYVRGLRLTRGWAPVLPDQ